MTTDDPQQSLSNVPAEAQRSQPQARIARNIRAICILYVTFGCIVAPVGTLGLFSAEEDGMPVAVASLFLICGLAGVLSATGVLRRRKWGIPFCQIMSVLYLVAFPIGTILGGYFLLKIDSVRDQFR